MTLHNPTVIKIPKESFTRLLLSLGVIIIIFLASPIKTQASSNNTLFNCTFGDPLNPQTFSITARDLGSSTTQTSLSATGSVQANPPPGYQVSMNLYQYQCQCPNVNQATCGGPGDGQVCTHQTVRVTQQGQTTTTTNLTANCATLQSDVNLGGVTIRYGNGNWMAATCTGNATLSPHLKQITAYAAYMCQPASQPTITPTTAPITPPSTLTSTPTSPPTATPTSTPTPPPTSILTPPGANVPSFWQVFSGLVFAQSNLFSNLPVNPPANQPPNFLINKYSTDTINSAGLVQTRSTSPSALNLGQGQITQRAQDQWSSQVRGHQINHCQNYPFAYFAEKLLPTASSSAIDEVPIVDTTINRFDQFTWLPNLADGTRIAFFRGNLTLSPETSWEVQNGKYVLLIDGNVVITDPNQLSNQDQGLITVTNSGFFGVIASGNITFEANIGSSIATTYPENFSIQGLYLAYGTLQVNTTQDPTSEKQFVGAGSFIGCQTVNLFRSFGNDQPNSQTATELFVYQPSLLLSAPKAFSQLNLSWQEIL